MRLKRDGTCAETRIRLSRETDRVHLNRRGASVQSTNGNRGVRISGSNAGYTVFRGSMKGTGYPLHSSVSPFTSPPVRHRVASHFNWILVPSLSKGHKERTQFICTVNSFSDSTVVDGGTASCHEKIQ
jgi:hypothetical protein